MLDYFDYAGRCSESLFSSEKVLYGRIRSDYDGVRIVATKTIKPIKATEYFAVVEALEDTSCCRV